MPQSHLHLHNAIKVKINLFFPKTKSFLKSTIFLLTVTKGCQQSNSFERKAVKWHFEIDQAFFRSCQGQQMNSHALNTRGAIQSKWFSNIRTKECNAANQKAAGHL